jgi:hypothetical protein
MNVIQPSIPVLFKSIKNNNMTQMLETLNLFPEAVESRMYSSSYPSFTPLM